MKEYSELDNGNSHVSWQYFAAKEPFSWKELKKYKNWALISCIIISLFFLILGILIWQLSPRTRTNELQNFCADVPPIQPSEYLSRQLSLSQLLQTNQQPDAIIFEPGPDMTYFTGVKWGLSERPFLNIFLKNSTLIWLCPSFEVTRAMELIPEGSQIILWEEDQNPYEIISTIIQSINPTNPSLGFSDEIRYFIVKGLETEFNFLKIDVTETISSLRIVKSEAEIALLRCANIATKKAIKLASEKVYKGMTEEDLGIYVDQLLALIPLTNTWRVVLFGSSAAFPHGTQQITKLRKGEMILIDAGGSLHDYQSDITRTFPFGKIDEEVSRAWETVRDAQLAALAEVQPGVKAGDLDEIARNITEINGFGTKYELFKHRLGHGIGIQGHENPYLILGNNFILKNGNSFSIEPGLYDMGKFGVRLEDIVLVTEDGHEVFGALPGPIDDVFQGH